MIQGFHLQQLPRFFQQLTHIINYIEFMLFETFIKLKQRKSKIEYTFSGLRDLGFG